MEEKLCILPNQVINVLQLTHDNKGHFRTQITIDFIRKKLWWPTMRQDIVNYIKTCDICQCEGPRQKHNLLNPTLTETPFETIVVDLIEKLERTDEGNMNIVTITDSMTK